MTLEELYADKSDLELRKIVNDYAPQNVHFQTALRELSKREAQRDFHTNKEKQNNHKWQEYIQAVLERSETILKRSDRKTFWILIIAGGTFITAILIEFLKK